MLRNNQLVGVYKKTIFKVMQVISQSNRVYVFTQFLQLIKRATATNMSKTTIENVEKIIVNTGNMLTLNDITKKPGQNPTEELIEAINITIKEFEGSTAQPPEPNRLLVVNRSNDDLTTKLNENDLSDLKIGLKVFVNSYGNNCVKEAIEKAFSMLHVQHVHDIIIAFKQPPTEKDNFEEVKNVWKILEDYNKSGKIKQLGVADVEEALFVALYNWSEIKPSIIQINLATCCVVPPTLQAFCKENDIKLLTHSDPADILPTSSIETIFGKPLSLKWALRFLIHIKCRGVLTTKGYLLSLDSSSS